MHTSNDRSATYLVLWRFDRGALDHYEDGLVGKQLFDEKGVRPMGDTFDDVRSLHVVLITLSLQCGSEMET